MSHYRIFQALGQLLLGLGIFELLASAIAILFWLVAGAWQPYVFLIVVIAFVATWPVAFLIWRHRRLH